MREKLVGNDPFEKFDDWVMRATPLYLGMWLVVSLFFSFVPRAMPFEARFMRGMVALVTNMPLIGLICVLGGVDNDLKTKTQKAFGSQVIYGSLIALISLILTVGMIMLIP